MSKEHTKFIFLHLPKNGGKTILPLITRLYKNEEVMHIRWVGEKGNLEDFHSMPSEKRASIKALTGHFDYGEHKYLEGESEYFTIMRDPVLRIKSYYDYLQHNPQNRLYKEVVETKMSFLDFIKLSDKDGNEGQIRKLSGLNGESSEMLRVAKENIKKHFVLVGIQEMYDESLIVLAHKRGWPTPYYIKQNVSKKKKTIIEKEQIVIRELNSGDIALYEEMIKELRNEISAVPFFKIKLLKLKIMNYLISNNLFRTIVGRKPL